MGPQVLECIHGTDLDLDGLRNTLCWCRGRAILRRRLDWRVRVEMWGMGPQVLECIHGTDLDVDVDGLRNTLFWCRGRAILRRRFDRRVRVEMWGMGSQVLKCIHGTDLDLDGLRNTLFFETVGHPNLTDDRPRLEKQEA